LGSEFGSGSGWEWVVREARERYHQGAVAAVAQDRNLAAAARRRLPVTKQVSLVGRTPRDWGLTGQRRARHVAIESASK